MSDPADRTAPLVLTVDSGPVTTIALTGDLDPATAPQLEAAVTEALAQEALTKIVFDLTDLGFLDSSGLRAFVTSREQLAARGATLALRRPNANIRRLLDVTGLDEVIEVE